VITITFRSRSKKFTSGFRCLTFAPDANDLGFTDRTHSSQGRAPVFHGYWMHTDHDALLFLMVGARIAPITANPKPCMIVSDHTAFQCMVICD
jgi:hypothetical protein